MNGVSKLKLSENAVNPEVIFLHIIFFLILIWLM